MIKHKLATGLVRAYMKYMGYYGWTGFNRTIYYISSEAMSNLRLQRHELKHIEQIERLGRFRFVIEYLYQSVRYGYDKNKFEIEAREAANI
ncbi:MAG: hypothetical protein U9O94_04935 [Nanoarchaeota archaeon]|nr:hypothetical protein [Nanoarchaeota archaeon]